MKIRSPLRAAYAEQRPIYDALKTFADDVFQKPCRDRRWHYESRVKEELSYALKIETGRVVALDAVEDFFASTIVVRNSSEIGQAVKLVRERFQIKNRRPPSRNTTPHRPASFEFDDLRLYVKLKDNPARPPRPEADRVFEVQIKTFLFHAWAIATHDLMYKANDANWGRERIAFQVRAMLEHAETTIEQAGQLAKAASLEREDRATQELRDIIEVIKHAWPADQLPLDLRRLSQNIRDLLRLLNVELVRWKTLVCDELASAPPPLDENPYQFSVRLFFQHEEQALRAFFDKGDARRKIVVYDTFDRPDWFDPTSTPAVLWIDS
jgi:ppGpp synthetase/RelA/SpoT-type nucleotidyltranferase